jgi:RNA polymerase sigma-70 factor (ECF subfamily)
MLRRDWLRLVGPDRGSFRGFLRTSVRNFINNRHRTACAQKRGGNCAILSIDTEECERELDRVAGSSADPAALYEKSWARCVLEAALARLAAEQSDAGRAHQFEQLRPYLTAPPAPGDYERIAAALNIPTGQVAVWVHRLSRRFTEVIRAEVAATVADRSDVETELRYLLRLVSTSS